MVKNFYKNELINFRHKLKFSSNFQTSTTENQKIKELRELGFTTIQSDFSESEIDEIKHFIDETFLTTNPKIWRDSQNADMRLFGVESTNELIRRFNKDQNVLNILNAYTGIQASNVHTMMGRIRFQSKNLGSGGGWHRDTPEYRQVKSIIYLSDVDEQHGPFQYLVGSHKRSFYKRISKITNQPWNSFRYSEANLESLTNKGFITKTVLAKKGTILLADTSGIHRGMPIAHGTRYSLTNYIWNEQPVPPHIAKLLI